MANVTHQVLREVKRISETKLQLGKNPEESVPKQLNLNTVNNQNNSMLLDFIAGCLGGIAGVIVSHPLDTVKVHLQTQNPKNPKYRGTWHCLRTIVAQENVRGLYKGITSPLTGLSFVNAIVFGIYGNVQRMTADPNALSSHAIAGGVAGFFQSIVCAPMELAKTRIQLQANNPSGMKFRGPLHCILHIWKTEGLRGAFKGLIVTAARDVPGAAIAVMYISTFIASFIVGFAAYFSSYEYMMSLPSKTNSAYALFAGGFAGICSWIVCYPIDVIKTCIQADDPAKPLFKGYMDVIRKGYRGEGVKFFFRGILSTMIRSFPMNAATFFVVNNFMDYFQKDIVSSVTYTRDTQSLIGLEINVYHHPEPPQQHCNNKERFSLSPRYISTFGTFNEAVCQTEAFQLAIKSFPYEDEEECYSMKHERIFSDI